MSYLVLARKYRPQSFEDLVGQSHVARTLANAIAQNRVAHAFLFTGVRGVGKTTSARLLAKCLNCLGADGKATGPTAKPCQVCAACREIAVGNDIDVQEIDGASYNGVDEVRRLQEGLAFRPARDRFKVYIVDEVHMLSNAAWNAFLKTLEEPPPHVKFIFATTEVHKVPVTILSRCQRYDFKLIATQTIAAQLQEVLRREGLEAEEAAVAVLAREAAGSMRDAMSLLDQVIAYGGERLTADDVARVLGVADRTILHQLASALVAGDAASALTVVDCVAQQGLDLVHVARDLLCHLRNLVVAKVCTPNRDRDLLDLADEEVADVRALAAGADADDLQRLFQGFSHSFDDIARSGQPKMALEMTLVKLARRPALLPLDELLARLGDLEKRLLAGGSTKLQPVRGETTDPSAVRARAASSPSPDRGATGMFPAGATPRENMTPPPAVRGSGPGDRTRGSLALAEVEPRDVPPPFAAPPRDEPEPSPSSASPTRLERPANLDAWRAILARIREAMPSAAAVFEHGVPLEVNSTRVLIGYESESFEGTRASEPEGFALLQREVRAHFRADTRVALDLSARPGVTVAAIDSAERKAQLAAARSAASSHPLVQKAIAMFHAELRDVRLSSGED